MNIADFRGTLLNPPSTAIDTTIAADRTGLGRNAFAGDPKFFQSPIELGNLGTSLTLDRLNTAYPYNAGFSRTADALRAMGGATLNSIPTHSPTGYNVFNTSIEGILRNALRNQVLEESQRKLGLMKTLYDLYGQAGSTLGAQMELSAAQQAAYEKRKQGQKQIKQEWLGQIPVIGGILSSFI